MVRLMKLSRSAGRLLLRSFAAVAGALRLWLEGMGRCGVRRGRMRVVESLALGGRRQLVLVSCDGQEYLVGTGSESVQTIVLLQPGVAGVGMVSRTAPVERAPANSQRVKTGFAGVTSQTSATMQATMMKGTTMRETMELRPWLVTSAGEALEENRIREARSGKRRELWR